MTFPILTPPIIPTAFAEGAGTSYITNSGLLPTASQIGITNGAASLVDGFPPLNFQLPISQGGSGIPMSGQDLNAILYMITAHLQNLNAGVRYQFSSTLSAALGGYPVGAVLQDNARVNEYINVLANNTVDFNSNPSSIGVSWIKYASSGIIGEISAFSFSTPPSNWLACPTAISLQSTTGAYAALFAAIGYAWGGSGSNFSLPWIAAGGTLRNGGTIGASDVGSVIAHTHTGAVILFSGSGQAASSSTNFVNTGPTGSTGGTSNIAAGANVRFCFKYQ